MRFTINQSNVPTWAAGNTSVWPTGGRTVATVPLLLTITTTSVPIWRY